MEPPSATNSNFRRHAPKPLRVIVVGAGISGLAAGLAFALSGHSVVVLESVDELAEVGAGLQLAPNCTCILRRLGILEDVMKHASVLSGVSIRRYDSDDELGLSPLDVLGQRYRSPMAVIHRADLHRILLDAARRSGCHILLSHTVVAADPQFLPRVQAIRSETGTTVWFNGDVVLAADGIKSMLRRQMAQAGGHQDRRIPTRDAAYRLLIPRERIQHDKLLLSMLDQNVAMRYMGPGGHVMAYPVKGNTVYNMVLIHPDHSDDTEDSTWATQGDREAMLSFYSSWSPAIRAWLAHAGDDIVEWKLSERAPLPQRVRGSVALIGDAAQPMLPYVAQGAASGIEDAGVLAAAFTCTSDVLLALAVYETVRKRRAERIAASAAATGRALHLPDSPEQRARDEAIKNQGRGQAAASQDKWRDVEWQNYMWGTDVMRHTIQSWDELVAQVRKQQKRAGKISSSI
ncbi:3-hydroxybenzoate 6-hydroxylase [Colletotrichum kahawae]|uniref:3-hydroxybenzoate 6-hydroxylase n=1 Tax=Colletotrichum kahawae TaxID=34407 RepID=A0AAD9Y2K0_COLKA|nr:3-hydroxybenzoate 6-hydroxylase [Colletotrichum kahawae]